MSAILAALALANLRQGFARPGQAWTAVVMMVANKSSGGRARRGWATSSSTP